MAFTNMMGSDCTHICTACCCAAFQSARPLWSGPAVWWCWQTRAWSSTVQFKETLFPLSAGGKMILNCLRAGNAQRPSIHKNLPCKPGISTFPFISWLCVSVLPSDLKSKRTIPWLFAKWPPQMRAPIRVWWRTWLGSLKHPPRSLCTVSSTHPNHFLSSHTVLRASDCVFTDKKYLKDSFSWPNRITNPVL